MSKGMSRQDRGFTPNLEKLCQTLDDELQKLLDDLKEYLYKDKKLVNDKLYVYDYDEDLDRSNGVCAGRVCPHGGECVSTGGRGLCRCPRCSNEFAPVCGSDGISYGNRCKLQLEACRHRRHVQVLYDGPCSEY